MAADLQSAQDVERLFGFRIIGGPPDDLHVKLDNGIARWAEVAKSVLLTAQ